MYRSGFFVLTVTLIVVAASAYVFLPRISFIPFIYGGEREQHGLDHVLYAGDVMLARDVERLSEEYGAEYPYEGIRQTLARAHTAVANLEGAVPRSHEPTPDHGMAFSVHPSLFREAVSNGLDVFSLANNHALDFGMPGYEHTRTVCSDAGAICAGHPATVTAEDAVVTHSLNGYRVATVFIHATDTVAPGFSEAIQYANDTADLQVVYIHWGVEYEPLHDRYQQALAHSFIDMGADAVIGHHPHVVQDIELYRGVPIFYSLGNLIFDQYFDQAVQHGFMLTLEPAEGSVTYSLIPVSSEGTHAQPHPIRGASRTAFIQALNARSPTIDLSSHTFTLPQ